MRVFRAEMRLIQISVLVSILIIAAAIFFKMYDPEPRDPSSNTKPQNQTVQEPEAPPVIVCLGDSYTYGYPGKQDTSWPKYMEDELRVSVANAGKRPQTAEDLLERFDADVLSPGKPLMVIIFSGMGDALHTSQDGSQWLPVQLPSFQVNIDNMILKARDNGITPILVMPFSYPEADKQEYINQYREWMLGYATDNDVELVDFQEMLCDGDNGIKKQYSTNGKYPSPDGYMEMGKYIAEQLRDKIQ